MFNLNFPLILQFIIILKRKALSTSSFCLVNYSIYSLLKMNLQLNEQIYQLSQFSEIKMYAHNPSSHELTNDSQLKLPEIKRRVKSIGKIVKEKLKDHIKLPCIKNGSAKNGSSKNNKNNQGNKNKLKSTFARDLEGKLQNVLAGLNEKIPDEGYGSEDSDDFDLEFKIKKNKQMIQNGGFANLRSPTKQQKEANAQGLKVRLLEPKKQTEIIQEDRPKSSRDMSNDNQLIANRNQTLFQKRPKSSKYSASKSGASDAVNEKSNNQKNQNADFEDENQRFLQVRSNAQKNYPRQIKKENKDKSQKKGKLLPKSTFVRDIQSKIQNVLKEMNQRIPNGEQQSCQSDDFDLEYKIKKNKEMMRNEGWHFPHANKVDSEKLKEQFLQPKQEYQLNQERPKSSRDASNDNQVITNRNQKLFKKRPKSSRYTSQSKSQNKNENQQSVKKQANNSNNGMANEQQRVLQVRSQYKAKTQQQNNSIVTILKPESPKLQTSSPTTTPQYKNSSDILNIPKSGNAKPGRILRKNLIPIPNANTSKQIASKIPSSRTLSQQKKRTPRKLSKIKLQKMNENNKKSVEKQRKAISIEKKSNKLQSDQIFDKVIGQRQKKFNFQKALTTQQLKSAKKQLDQKIKKIQEEMKLLDSQNQFNGGQLNQGQQDCKIRMRFSSRNWKKVKIQGQKIQCQQSTFDNQLQKIQKLQNRGQHMFEDYLKNRMMLMDLNIHRKQQQIMQQAYIGDDEKDE